MQNEIMFKNGEDSFSDTSSLSDDNIISSQFTEMLTNTRNSRNRSCYKAVYVNEDYSTEDFGFYKNCNNNNNNNYSQHIINRGKQHYNKLYSTQVIQQPPINNSLKTNINLRCITNTMLYVYNIEIFQQNVEFSIQKLVHFLTAKKIDYFYTGSEFVGYYFHRTHWVLFKLEFVVVGEQKDLYVQYRRFDGDGFLAADLFSEITQKCGWKQPETAHDFWSNYGKGLLSETSYGYCYFERDVSYVKDRICNLENFHLSLNEKINLFLFLSHNAARKENLKIIIQFSDLIIEGLLKSIKTNIYYNSLPFVFSVMKILDVLITNKVAVPIEVVQPIVEKFLEMYAVPDYTTKKMEGNSLMGEEMQFVFLTGHGDQISKQQNNQRVLTSIFNNKPSFYGNPAFVPEDSSRPVPRSKNIQHLCKKMLKTFTKIKLK